MTNPEHGHNPEQKDISFLPENELRKESGLSAAQIQRLAAEFSDSHPDQVKEEVVKQYSESYVVKKRYYGVFYIPIVDDRTRNCYYCVMSNPEFGANQEGREYTIHGPNLTETDKQEVNEFIKGFSADAEEPVQGEIEKSPEIEQAIFEINQYRDEIAEELGLPKPIPLKPSQIHLLPPEDFQERYPNYSADVWANHENVGDGIFLKYKPRLRSLDITKMVLLHEGIHVDSFRAFFTRNVDGQAIDNLTGETRSGYATGKPMQEREHEHFLALNEAVVQKITWEKIRDRIPTVVNNPTYIVEIGILDAIINRIAEVNSEDEQIVWKRIKRGLFTGEMMHLRQIERVYGKGSLEILANLKMDDLEQMKKAIEYFKTTDYSRRAELSEQLLAMVR
jgi:hypothetical protein